MILVGNPRKFQRQDTKNTCSCLGIIVTESLRRWAWYLKCKACRNSNYKLTISKPYLKLIYVVVRVLRCVTPCRRRERSTFGVPRGRLITPTMTSVGPSSFAPSTTSLLSPSSSLLPSSVNYAEVIKRDNMHSSDRPPRKLVSRSAEQSEFSHTRDLSVATVKSGTTYSVFEGRRFGTASPRNRDLSSRPFIDRAILPTPPCVRCIHSSASRTHASPAMTGMQ